ARLSTILVGQVWPDLQLQKVNRLQHGRPSVKRVLRWAGQNGAAVVIAGVIIGLCIPFLSELARPYLSVAIFIFTFGSFLKFDSKSIGSEIANMKRNSLMILWATFGVPLSIVLIMMITRPGQELAQG